MLHIFLIKYIPNIKILRITLALRPIRQKPYKVFKNLFIVLLRMLRIIK